MRRYLVTGAAGFIGSHLTQRLIRDGHEVIALDKAAHPRVAGNSQSGRRNSRLRIVRHQLGDQPEESLKDVVRTCDFVFHLAADHVIDRVDSDKVLKANFAATRILMDALLQSRANVMVASSYEVYSREGGERTEESAVTLAQPTDREKHGLGKIADECIAKEFPERAMVARVFPTIGERQNQSYGSRIIDWILSAIRNAPLLLSHTGEEQHSYLHIDDLVEWMYRLSYSPAALGRAINLGNPRSLSVTDIAIRVLRAIKSRSEIHFEPNGETEENWQIPIPDVSLATRLTQYSPRVTLDDSIHGVHRWVRSLNLPHPLLELPGK